MRNAVVIALMLVLAAALGGSCGGGEPEPPPVASEALRAQIVQAVAPQGTIFHAKMQFVSAAQSSRAELAEVWIDGAQNRARRHQSVASQGGKPMVELYIEGRGWIYDPWPNVVDTTEAPPEMQSMAVQSPAVFVLPYAYELAMADEWRILDETPKGGRHFLVETRRVLETSGEAQTAGTVLRTIVELDRDTLLPVRENGSLIQPDGQEQSAVTVEFDLTEFLSPDSVPQDLFSPQSVYGLVTPR